MLSSARELSGELERDLDWRSAELAILRELVALRKRTKVRTNTLFRAAWLLRYAHYEGFCKYALQLYVEFLASLPSCECLCDKTFVFLHEAAIRRGKNKPEVEALRFFREEIDLLRGAPPPIVEVDTQSNWWPDVLGRILLSLDIPVGNVLDEMPKIKVLVARRNDIAHGKQVFFNDVKCYGEYEAATQALMYSLALAIVQKATDLSASANG